MHDNGSYGEMRVSVPSEASAQQDKECWSAAS